MNRRKLLQSMFAVPTLGALEPARKTYCFFFDQGPTMSPMAIADLMFREYFVSQRELPNMLDLVQQHAPSLYGGDPRG